MKRFSFVLIILTMATFFAMSQDIIVKKDGSVIKVYNLEEGKEVFYYTLDPSSEAQVLKIKKSEVFTTQKSDAQPVKPQESHSTKRQAAPQHEPVTATFMWEIEPMKIKKGKMIGRKFVARTPDRHELNYQVLSEDNYTLQVIKGDYKEESYIIPEYVMVDNEQYTVTEVGEKAFNGKKKVKEIQLPSTLIYIGKEAFSNTKFNNIVFPEGLQIIDELAFSKSSLEKIILPESLVELGISAFIFCSIGNIFYEIYIPSSIKKIGEGCFLFVGKNHSYRGFYQGYISNMPDFITEGNCKEYGIDEEAVRAYYNTKRP